MTPALIVCPSAAMIAASNTPKPPGAWLSEAEQDGAGIEHDEIGEGRRRLRRQAARRGRRRRRRGRSSRRRSGRPRSPRRGSGSDQLADAAERAAVRPSQTTPMASAAASATPSRTSAWMPSGRSAVTSPGSMISAAARTRDEAEPERDRGVGVDAQDVGGVEPDRRVDAVAQRARRSRRRSREGSRPRARRRRQPPPAIRISAPARPRATASTSKLESAAKLTAVRRSAKHDLPGSDGGERGADLRRADILKHRADGAHGEDREDDAEERHEQRPEPANRSARRAESSVAPRSTVLSPAIRLAVPILAQKPTMETICVTLAQLRQRPSAGRAPPRYPAAPPSSPPRSPCSPSAWRSSSGRRRPAPA